MLGVDVDATLRHRKNRMQICLRNWNGSASSLVPTDDRSTYRPILDCSAYGWGKINVQPF